MVDQFGGIDLPVQVPAAGEGAPDPALELMGAYLQAVLRAKMGAMWAVVAPGSVSKPADICRHFYPSHPEDVLPLQDASLPALFLWRSKSQHTREAEDYAVDKGEITLLWLIPIEQPDKLQKRLRVQSALVKVIQAALLEGRDPAWVMAGDTDPTAATRGSVLPIKAGFLYRLEPRESKPLPITIQPDGVGEPVKYRAKAVMVDIVERLERKPAVHGVTSTTTPNNAAPPTYPQPAALDLTLTQGGNVIDQLGPKP